MSEIMKLVDERETQRTTKKQRLKRGRGNRNYSERVRAKWFCCACKLGFLRLICNASLIFKWNLESALSIFLKQRELHESKHVALECRCLKIWDLLSFFTFLICPSILVLKWQQVLLIWLELQQAQVNLYTRKDFKSSGFIQLLSKKIPWLPSNNKIVPFFPDFYNFPIFFQDQSIWNWKLLHYYKIVFL